MRASPSLLAVTTREPSRDTSTERTSSRCPVSVTSPDGSRRVTSDPSTVARGSRVRRGAGVERSGLERRLQLRHPGAHGAVLARRRESVAGDEHGSSDGLCVPRKDGARTAGLHLPGPGRPVAARRQDRVLVGAEARAADMAAVQRHDRLGVTAAHVPDACGAVAAGRRRARRERGLKLTSKMLLFSPGPRSVRSRCSGPSPDDRVAVRAGGRDQQPVRAERRAVHARGMRQRSQATGPRRR